MTFFSFLFIIFLEKENKNGPTFSFFLFFSLQSAHFWLVIASASFRASPWALALQK